MRRQRPRVHLLLLLALEVGVLQDDGSLPEHLPGVRPQVPPAAAAGDPPSSEHNGGAGRWRLCRDVQLCRSLGVGTDRDSRASKYYDLKIQNK